MQLEECLMTDVIRQRIMEHLGGSAPNRLSCIGLSNSRDAKDVCSVSKSAAELDYFLRCEKDISRSLLDTDYFLLDLDMEYVNFDFPAEPYLDRMRAFSLQQPAFTAVRAALAEFGLEPLCYMTGRGYHFVWKVRKDSISYRRLAAIGRLTNEISMRYRSIRVFDDIPISTELGKAFAGAGLLMEFLTHRIKARLGGFSEIPVQILEVIVGPQQRGREIISLDISEYGDPLDTRFVRIPYSIYLKPFWKPGILTPFTQGKIPFIAVSPVDHQDFADMVTLTQNPWELKASADRACAVIPDLPEGTERLIAVYESSDLRQFHNFFYDQEHEPFTRWPDTYDRMETDGLPACVRHILAHPNDLLLKPGAIRLITAVLLSRGWHPRHIAGLIRSKYERNYGWLNEWYVYDASTRADFYTRVFAGLIHSKADPLEDLTCRDLRKALLCWSPACCGDPL